MFKIKYFIQQSWLLIVSSSLFGLLIAATNYALSERIEGNKTEKFNLLTGALLPGAKPELATTVEIDSIGGKKEKVNIYKAVTKMGECVGWSFKAAGSGFQDKIELVIAVNKNIEKIVG